MQSSSYQPVRSLDAGRRRCFLTGLRPPTRSLVVAKAAAAPGVNVKFNCAHNDMGPVRVLVASAGT